jgi:hypothetical protein
LIAGERKSAGAPSAPAELPARDAWRGQSRAVDDASLRHSNFRHLVAS